jgi:glycosyltransferase involved in cell wall biosynthesis
MSIVRSPRRFDRINTMVGKRILILGNCNAGGLAHYVHEVGLNLTRLGHEVTLMDLGPFEVPEHFRRYDVLEVQRVNGPSKVAKGLSNLKLALAALRFVGKRRPDAVLINGYDPLMTWPFAFLRPRGIPLFCIQHEVEPRIGKRRISWCQQNAYTRMTAMVVHRNNHSRDLLLHKYRIKVPILVIDHGLYETNLFGKQPEDVSAFKKSILSFGMVRSDKGLDLLVKAYPGSEKCQGLRLVIAGRAKGNYGEYFSKVVAGRSDVIWDPNYVPLAKTGALYREAAFAVLPFIECTQSGSLRLAMFFETPVIASAVGEIPDFINTHQVGMLVSPGNVGGLREAIATLANEPRRQAEYRLNIRRLNESQELSWQKIIQKLLQELEEKHLFRL